MRYLGLAFLLDGELMEADIKDVRHMDTSPKEIGKAVKRILLPWITRHQPQVLVIEKLLPIQRKRSPLLEQLVRHMKSLAKRKGLVVREYPVPMVRRFICETDRPTKIETARVIATEHFPWLHFRYEQEVAKTRWWDPYWTHMFDAIAVGLVCHHDIAASHTDQEAA